MYGSGEGVQKDETKAIELYRKAAEHGHIYTQENLGLMYYYGAISNRLFPGSTLVS